MVEKNLDKEAIEKILSHRRPFLFLESAIILEPGKRAIGRLPDLTHPDFAYLKGHFPNLLIFPGPLIMEALAELSGVIAASDGMAKIANRVGLLVEDHMRYKKPIFLHESNLIELEAEIISLRHGLCEAMVKAIKGDQIATEGTIKFLLVDKSLLKTE